MKRVVICVSNTFIGYIFNMRRHLNLITCCHASLKIPVSTYLITGFVSIHFTFILFQFPSRQSSLYDNVCNIRRANHVRSWLRNRPKTFIRQCMRRLSRCCEFSADHAVQLSNGWFHAILQASDIMYEVIMNFEYVKGRGPWRQCQDWRHTGLPC
jgi:hypothetical protein